MHVTNASGTWVTETVDAGGVGFYTSIALDSSDKVHISYSKSADLDLKYATDASGSWVTAIVESNGNVGLNTSIALDSFGNVHISYIEWDPGAGNVYYLKYAKKVSGSWVIETIDDTGVVGWSSTSICIDSLDNMHISYYDKTNEALRYATNASGVWVIQTVDDDGDAGRYSSITVDSLDYLHISYIERTNADLKYATNASGAWVTGTVDNDARVTDTTSIALDSLDNVYISYPGSLKFATNVSGAWVTETVDYIPSHNTFNSIAIDSSDGVHISYFDNSSKDLKYLAKAGMPNIADISVSMTDNPDPVQVNQLLTYSVTITNNGSDTAKDVDLTDDLPADVTLDSVSSEQGTCNYNAGTHQVTCGIGNINNGDEVVVTIEVDVSDTSEIITNTATVATASNDPDPSNNTYTEYTIVQSPEPSIEDTIDFFDEAVEDGTLEGSFGWFWWGQIQLNIMRQHLTRARFSIERGYIGAACWRLRRAYLGCDGEGYDWVVGEDAGELAQMIYDLAVSLDCWWTAN